MTERDWLEKVDAFSNALALRLAALVSNALRLQRARP
jgi:hypothetical protein